LVFLEKFVTWKTVCHWLFSTKVQLPGFLHCQQQRVGREHHTKLKNGDTFERTEAKLPVLH